MVGGLGQWSIFYNNPTAKPRGRVETIGSFQLTVFNRRPCTSLTRSCIYEGGIRRLVASKVVEDTQFSVDVNPDFPACVGICAVLYELSLW